MSKLFYVAINDVMMGFNIDVAS